MNLRVLVEKDGMYGVLAAYPYESVFLLTSRDDRMDKPTVKIAQNERDARKQFDEAVAVCVDRGWTVLYYGRPAIG